ncbi:MAG TPA: hypothetical protein VNH11_26795 [Pirellulales bacterium]|nr:hypothetical protein [Pirellulales bacterium]
MTKRFQFSVRWIFAVTAIIGLICATLLTKPTPVTGSLFLLLLVVIPAVVVVGIIQGRGYVRAFCIGAAIPSSFGMIAWWEYVGAPFASGGPFNHLQDARGFVPTDQATFIWAAALLTGLVCVGFYWLIKSPKED